MDINKTLQGLLGSPAFNMGVGLLSAGGNRRGPKVSFGQGLLEASQFANQQVGQAQKLEAQRNALQQQKRQQNALNRATSIMNRGLLSPQQIAQGVQGQMGTGLDDAGMMDPQAQRNLLGGTQFWNNVQNNQQAMLPGLLAQANPGAFTQSAIQAQFAPPTNTLPNSIQEFMAAQQMPPEMRNQFMEFAGNSPSALERAQLAQISQAFQQGEQDQLLENAELQSNATTRVQGRRDALQQIENLVDTMSGVRGTLAQTGGFAPDVLENSGKIATVLRGLGFDDSQVEGTATTLNDLEKGFNRLVGSTIPQAFLGSDNRLSFYRDQSPGLQQQLGTNLKILKDMIIDVQNAEAAASPVLTVLGVEGNTNLNSQAQRLIQKIDSLLAGGNQSTAPAMPEGFQKDQ